jgi:hypothetical protein
MADHSFTGTLSVADKIGVGTEEPIAQLHILSSTAAPSQAFLESGGALLKFSVDANGAAIGTDNAFPLSIKTDDIPRISIDKVGKIVVSGALSVQNTLTVSGNVGIGTTQPLTEKLEVAGKIKATELEASGTIKAAIFQGDGSALTGAIAIAFTHNLTDGENIDVPPGFTREECIFSVAIQSIDFYAILQLIQQEKNRPFPKIPSERQENYCYCRVDRQGTVSTFPKQAIVATGTAIAKKGGW